MMLKNLFKRKKAKSHTAPADPHLGFKGLSMADLDLIQRFGKASNSLGGYTSKPFVELPYGIVRKDLPTLQKKELHLEYITMILEAQYERVELSGVSANDIMSFLLWIKQQQDIIYHIEEQHLSSDPDPLAVAAGVHKLDEFGALSTIHQLAGGDPLKHAAIEALPYYKIYEILKLEKINKDISKAYAELSKKQTK